MALPKIGFNEGSLLRRTLLHVGTFVLGSTAFIALTSFVLVSIAKGLVSPHAGSVATTDEEPVPAMASALGPKGPAPLVRPGSVRPAGKRMTIPASLPTRND